MQVSFNNLSVHSIATAIPSETFDLKNLYDMYGMEEINRIIKANGISKVLVAEDGICASDLCEKAANVLLSESDVDKNEIDGLIFVSQTPDYILPATSTILQDRLKLSNECVCFDISNGCPGYIYGLFQAALLIGSGSCQSVLVCVGDVITPFINPGDKSTRMVFGDAGSASLIKKGTDKFSFSIITDGSKGDNLIIPAGGCRNPKDEDTEMVSIQNDGNLRSSEDLFMNGIEVMNFSVKEVPKQIQSLLMYIGWDSSEVDLFGFHQANLFMLNNLRRIMKLPKDKVPVSMEQTGNTGLASIPLMLTQEFFQKKKKLEKSILCGFGVGLSCASVALNLNDTLFFKPVEV